MPENDFLGVGCDDNEVKLDVSEMVRTNGRADEPKPFRDEPPGAVRGVTGLPGEDVTDDDAGAEVRWELPGAELSAELEVAGVTLPVRRALAGLPAICAAIAVEGFRAHSVSGAPIVGTL